MFEKSSVPTVISVDSLPKSHVNEFGLPPPVMRCFEITEVISYMKDLIDFALDNNFAPINSLEKFHQQVAIPEMQLYQQHLQQRQQPQSQTVQSNQPVNSTIEQDAGTTSNTGKDETIKSEDSKKDKHNESHGEDENVTKQDKPRELLLVDQSNQFKNGDEEDENDNQTDEEAPTNTRKRPKKTRPAPKTNKRRKTK